MSLHKLADDTARDVLEKLGHGTDQLAEVSQIIEAALEQSIRGTKEGCIEAVNICCSADQDLAHKIAEQLRLKEKALIANLSSLR
jgi:methionine aminopeptidase